MRNLSFRGVKFDKKYLFAFLITLICAIICGIVLYKPVTFNIYFVEFADDYVYNVFNFKNSALLFPHLLGDVLYFYICFLLAYFTRFKYFSLFFVFLRGIFFSIYSVILIAVNSVGGVIVACFVFIPASLISLMLCFLIVETCKCINKKYVCFMPAVFAFVSFVVLFLLINVLFRVVIVMV